MFENIKNIFKRSKKRELLKSSSKDTAKERLHLVLMQDRANVSADFLDLMRQEIIEVIKKYIDIDEEAMDVRLATETNEDGTQGAPALYANIPIINILIFLVIKTTRRPEPPPKANIKIKAITASKNFASPLTKPSLPKCPVKVSSFSSFFKNALISFAILATIFKLKPAINIKIKGNNFISFAK